MRTLPSSWWSRFVPKHAKARGSDAAALKSFVEAYNRILVLTGAGISTESGIPDYRSEGVGLYARSNHRPVQYHDFLRSKALRQRYWARNYAGWENFSRAEPNLNHLAIRSLQMCENSRISGLITQNVDNLHIKAGSEPVIELHGNSHWIVCLGCDFRQSRHAFQTVLKDLNPFMSVASEAPSQIRPDGDVELTPDQTIRFKVPDCPVCKGILKPDIVFFGDNVPRQRVEAVDKLVLESEALLALGTSLTVFSSFRIALAANERQLPIVLVNIGPTRADHLASLKIPAKCSDILGQFV